MEENKWMIVKKEKISTKIKNYFKNIFSKIINNQKTKKNKGLWPKKQKKEPEGKYISVEEYDRYLKAKQAAEMASKVQVDGYNRESYSKEFEKEDKKYNASNARNSSNINKKEITIEVENVKRKQKEIAIEYKNNPKKKQITVEYEQKNYPKNQKNSKNSTNLQNRQSQPTKKVQARVEAKKSKPIEVEVQKKTSQKIGKIDNQQINAKKNYQNFEKNKNQAKDNMSKREKKENLPKRQSEKVVNEEEKKIPKVEYVSKGASIHKVQEQKIKKEEEKAEKNRIVKKEKEIPKKQEPELALKPVKPKKEKKPFNIFQLFKDREKKKRKEILNRVRENKVDEYETISTKTKLSKGSIAIDDIDANELDPLINLYRDSNKKILNRIKAAQR